MRKADVIKLFGSTTRTGNALGISHQAVSDWPDILTPAIADRVRGACTRLQMKPSDIAALDKRGRR